MILFDGQDLFSSGPAHVSVSGTTLRRAIHAAPDAVGVRLVAQGREARPLTQVGTLLADTSTILTARIADIESHVDGRPATLDDGLGRTWDHVVMLRFAPTPLTRLGPRWRCDYRVEYLQVSP